MLNGGLKFSSCCIVMFWDLVYFTMFLVSCRCSSLLVCMLFIGVFMLVYVAAYVLFMLGYNDIVCLVWVVMVSDGLMLRLVEMVDLLMMCRLLYLCMWWYGLMMLCLGVWLMM